MTLLKKRYKDKQTASVPLIMALLTVSASVCMGQAAIQPKQLLCESKTNPLGIATTVPRFSWINKAAGSKVTQTAYRILVASSPTRLNEGKGDLWDTGKTAGSDSVWIPYQGSPLQSRSVGYWKIRVWDQDGIVSGWSETARFSVGLLEGSDWSGSYIGMKTQESVSACPLLRRTLILDRHYDELFLQVNSLGYHEVHVNHRKVGDAVLAPAESQFDKRSFSLSYDLSPYLKQGKNTVVLWLGYGWYRHAKIKAHNGPLVRAQLDAFDGSHWDTLLKTDDTWLVSESEYSGTGFECEVLNANKILADFSDASLDDSAWRQADVFPVPDHLVTPQVVERNRFQQTIHARDVKKIGDQAYLVDMGTNLTGVVRIRFPSLPRNQTVTIQYTDHLTEGENSLYRMQCDRYVSSGGAGVFETKFEYRGFRYLKISNLPQALTPDAINAYLIHTDFRPAATFVCSDDLLNRLHNMFAYTLKCLMLGGKIVDCPHYERMGYGGDGNASTMTAQTLYDLGPLYTTWLTHWIDCVGPDGSMPHTAPSYYRSGGGPYWCAFIVKAAWETYLNYGDARVLETCYPTMLKWLGYVQAYSPQGLLEKWPDTERRAWYLGDWATPEGIDQKDPRSVGLVSNCAIVDCYDKMAKIAAVLNRRSDVDLFTKKKQELALAVHAEYYHADSATYGTGVQIDLAYPLILGMVPDALKENVVQSLLSETRVKHDGHFATGLVGLPIITQWAVSNEASELMYDMMTKRDFPGFGYMLEQGATTTWEHWNGQRSRIHNCYHGTGSWFYQSLGGIHALEDYPGYQRFLLAPRPPRALTWARITKETPFGTIKVDWKKERDQMRIKTEIPVGSMAKLVLPVGTESCLIDNHTYKPDQDRAILIDNGTYEIIYGCSKGKE